MVPMSTVSKISMTTGPDILQRYNMFRTAEINGANGPGISTGEALTSWRISPRKSFPGLRLRVDQHRLPGEGSGRHAGTDLRHGDGLRVPGAGGAVRELGGAVLRAAGIAHLRFRRLLGVKLVGLENNVYVQIGIVALMGLAAKNAILIVEFAKEYHERKGMGLVAAATEGAKLRFRPIMMTAFAFILGVVPLVMASGAGAAARVSIGIAVFAGMLMASTVGLFFIPMLYVVIQGAAYLVGGNRKAIQGTPGVSLRCRRTRLMRCETAHRLVTAAL